MREGLDKGFYGIGENSSVNKCQIMDSASNVNSANNDTNIIWIIDQTNVNGVDKQSKNLNTLKQILIYNQNL